MSKYKYLLWDIDSTILNFDKAEKTAIQTLFEKHNLCECIDEMLSHYIEIKSYLYHQELTRIGRNSIGEEICSM